MSPGRSIAYAGWTRTAGEIRVPGTPPPGSRLSFRAPPMAIPQSTDAFTIERRGGVTIISATPAIETLALGLEEQAAELIYEPLRDEVEPAVVIDLSRVDYFGSVFLGVLMHTWKLVSAKGGTMALSGVSPRAKQLLHVTSFDFLWPIYNHRSEAIEALIAD